MSTRRLTLSTVAALALTGCREDLPSLETSHVTVDTSSDLEEEWFVIDRVDRG